MSHRISQCRSLLLVVCMTRCCAAQNGPTEKQISEAVERGRQFLQTSQRFDGSWPYHGHNVGMTAFAALALLESGVPASDSRLVDAHNYVIKNASGIVRTYDISATLLFMDRYESDADKDVPDKKLPHKELMVGLAQRLTAGQLVSGGWTYTCPENSTRTSGSQRNSIVDQGRGRSHKSGELIDLRRDAADNSNTQFAVLGLWAARHSGVDVDATMERVNQRFRTTQSRTGQWDYRPGTKLTSDAMSCAGLVSLLLAKAHRTIKQNEDTGGTSKTTADSLEMPSDEIIDRALIRVGRIRIGSKASNHLIWCLGRVAIALDRSELGGVPWYERGTRILVRSQNRDGSWINTKPIPPSSRTADTAFALLFLSRSNLTRDVPRLATNPQSKLRPK